MPCLDNLLSSTTSVLPDFSPCPEFKPFLKDTHFDPELNPDVAQEPGSDLCKLGFQLTESNGDDNKQEEFRGDDGSPVPEPAPGKDFCYLSKPKLRLTEVNDDGGDGIDGALSPCRVKGPTTEKLVQEWSKRRIEEGIPEFKCSLPFLVGAAKSVQCRVCQKEVYPEENILCSVRSCRGVYHLTCAKESISYSSSKQFKCPQHACFLCEKKNNLWRCIRCPIACHDKCAPFPENVLHFRDRPGEAICWRHPADWRLEKVEPKGANLLWSINRPPKPSSSYDMLNLGTAGSSMGLPYILVFFKPSHEVSVNNVEDIFSLLPIPYNEEEFKIDIKWKDQGETKAEPHPYVQIKRNVYLVKRKRNNVDADIGCTNCTSTQCSDGCVCRVQCISCSKACRCSKNCANRPFQKMKKIQIVKTELCGWGVVAAESISKGEFIIEYVGEVIDDVMCERRLWDMKDQDAKNFYMCEITRDFVIDATFKGNASRFLNHSCAPNCKLEKWQVEGETRVGVFAARSIEVGEALTYDYRFIQFGPEVECHCGAPNCHGYLGTKRKAVFGSRTKRKADASLTWGPKRQRTASKMVGIVIN